MQIKELGEFRVIGILTEMLASQRSNQGNAQSFSLNLSVDNGDDTAAWSVVSSEIQSEARPANELFTTDTMVEGVHFTRETTSWQDLGWKSLASNISDVASMGGLPAYALITLGLPHETEIADLENLYQGMIDISNEYGLTIVGGDMVRSPVVFITVALIGVMSGEPMVRTMARPGDLVAVSGYLGNSSGGLKLMLEGESQQSESEIFLVESHRRPRPSVAIGKTLADSAIVAAMDVSDGLGDDLSKLCLASNLSANIFDYKLPIHPLLRSRFPDDCVGLALGGGEDYVLLFTGSPDKVNQVILELPAGAAVVGEILHGEPGCVTVFNAQGEVIPVGKRGWDHFG